MKDHEEKSGHFSLKGLAVAAALAAGLGLLFHSKKGQEVKEDMMEHAKKLAKRFDKSRKQVQEEVKDIFGKVSDELESDYLEVHAHLLAEVDDLKDKKDLTEAKYGEMADKVVEKFSKGRDWTKQMVTKLESSLKKAWKSVVKDS